jgi:drug/metabolite transporter (DMT)-like permease
MNTANKKSDHSEVNLTGSKLSMLMSGICMGTVGLFVTLLGNYQVYTIVLLRGIFGLLFLTLIMIKTHSFSREFLRESFKFQWKPLLISGLVYPIIIYCYFYTIMIHGYAVAAFLLYTSGIFVLFFIIITKMDYVSKINIICFLLAIIGVAIIMEFWKGFVYSLSLYTGILSGFALGIFVFYKKIIYNKRKNPDSNLKAKGNFDVFLAWWHLLFLIFPFLVIGSVDLLRLTLMDLIFAMLLGLIPTALAFALYNVGVKNDKGGNIIILSYIEPVVATILTVLVLKSLSIFTVLGGSLILIANIIILKYSKTELKLNNLS